MESTASQRRDPVANLPTLGLLCLIAAATGGGFAGFGITFPNLSVASRLLIALLGICAIFFESRAQIAVWLTEHGLRASTKIAAVMAVVAIGGLLVLIVQRQFVAPDPPLQLVAPQYVPPRRCPVRQDTPTLSATDTQWIYVGAKLSNDSDALDANRNIVEPCVPRNGETFTIYRATHTWIGSDPAALANGKRSVTETDDVLKPGEKVVATGGVSGPTLMNGKGQLLYYEVWVPVRRL